MDKLFYSSQTDRTSKNYKKTLNNGKSHYYEVVEAKHIAEYKIQIFFSDGKVQIIDFEPFLKNSKNPHIKKFLEPDNFNQFSLLFGDIVWKDYELCFPVSDLYDGKI